MNFQAAKDEFLKWLVPALLLAVFTQVSDLKEQQALTNSKLVGHDRDISFHEYRLGKHSDLIVNLSKENATQNIQLGKLEQKVFPQRNM